MAETQKKTATRQREGKTLSTVVPEEFANRVSLAAQILEVPQRQFMIDALSAYLVEVQDDLDAVAKTQAAAEAALRKARERRSTS